MVTAPINKEAMNLADSPLSGAYRAVGGTVRNGQVRDDAGGDLLRVSLVTILEALRDVPALLSVERVLTTIRVTGPAFGA